jgi:hypothetical protein
VVGVNEFSRIAKQLAAREAVTRQLEQVTKWEAEKAAAPIVTRNAVLATNERMDDLLNVTKELAEASLALSEEATKQTRLTNKVMWISVGVLLVALVTLVVTLLK